MLFRVVNCNFMRAIRLYTSFLWDSAAVYCNDCTVSCSCTRNIIYIESEYIYKVALDEYVYTHLSLLKKTNFYSEITNKCNTFQKSVDMYITDGQILIMHLHFTWHNASYCQVYIKPSKYKYNIFVITITILRKIEDLIIINAYFLILILSI